MFARLKDHLNREVTLDKAPKRIVSLVPSQTELLHALGLEDEVLGITKFCVHPPNWKRVKKVVGGTKNLSVSKIEKLHPDLILANKEENEKSLIENLSNSYPTWVSDVNSLESAEKMILDIGELTGKSKKAKELLRLIQQNFRDFSPCKKPHKVAYLIWKNPFMTIGGDTFINSMLSICGLQNAFGHKKRYPETTIEELSKLGCDTILLSTEPYPFNKTHLNELQLALPNSKVILADGEYFSWYGSRLEKAPAYFERIIKEIEG